MNDVVNRLIDPFDLMGQRKDEGWEKYKNAKDEYDVLWRKAEKMGIPVELLGFKRPIAGLKAGGGKGLVPGPPGLSLPFVPTERTNMPPQVLDDIRNQVIRLREVINTVESGPTPPSNDEDEMKHDSETGEPVPAPKGGGWRPPQQAGDSTNQNSNSRAREVISLSHSNSKERKRLKKDLGGKLVNSTIISRVLERMIGNRNSILRVDRPTQVQIREVIRKFWKKNETFQNRLLNIFNDHGIYFEGFDRGNEEIFSQKIFKHSDKQL
jgi:hypothetical protein